VGWGGGVILSSTTDASATFTMPDGDVVVLAVFQALPVATSVGVGRNPPWPWHLWNWLFPHTMPGTDSLGFIAHVSGTNNPPTTVIWSIEGNTSSGTFISAETGTLTVCIDETARDLIIRATSTFDPSVSGIYTVRVLGLTRYEVLIVNDANSPGHYCCCHKFSIGYFNNGYRLVLASRINIDRRHPFDPDLIFTGGLIDMESGEFYSIYSYITINRPRIFEIWWGRAVYCWCCNTCCCYW